VFQEGSLWNDSLRSAVKDTPSVLQKIADFKRSKAENPLNLFGTSDKPFAAEGIYKNYLQKARKAHLTPDISLVYELSGRNPTTIKLYGVFTHADLGTGQPANKKIQKNMATRLSNSFSEEVAQFLNSLLQE
jgi:mRNA-degrading endonuclease YafQ of YafQ-DinJ toxin-antitoxin module